MTKVTVQAGQTTLEGLVRTPTTGLKELIWNSFDADAENVRIRAERNGLEGVEAITVSDDGVGMSHIEAERAFARHGDSWKARPNATSENKKRPLHGKKGQGRYTAFALGNTVRWTSIVNNGNQSDEIVITGNKSSLTEFDLTETAGVEQEVGTCVRISNLDPSAQKLPDDYERLHSQIVTEFALHLERHKDFSIELFGKNVDPAAVRKSRKEVPVEIPSGIEGEIKLIVIEWNIPRVDRRMYLLDNEGAIVNEIRPGVQAPGSDFTAFLQWPGFTERQLILDDEEGTDSGQVLASARKSLKAHLKESARRREEESVKKWQTEGIYPYQYPPANHFERSSRQAFHVVAQAFSGTIDSTKSIDSKAMMLSLLKEAFEHQPETVLPILEKVTKLPKDRVEEFKTLLDSTDLSNLISAGRLVGDRLEFINGLDSLVFDLTSKKHTKERRQLHRILANETWIFGEEWSLVGDDVRLEEVLKNHRKYLDEYVELRSDEIDLTAPTPREDGSTGIPDLVLGGTMETQQDVFNHLVVELKRPGHTLTDDDITQIRSYASAIHKDPRFDQGNVNWEFWLVGSKMQQSVKDQRDQPYFGPGVIQERPYRIIVRTWAEIIGAAKYRLKFVQDTLEYSSDKSTGMKYLQENYDQYLPDELKDPSNDEAASTGAESCAGEADAPDGHEKNENDEKVSA